MANRYFKLWLAFLKNTLSRDMEFKLNFIFEIFIDGIYYGSLFFFFKVIFQFVDTLGDFNQDAVIIFLITMYITDSLYTFLLGGNVFEINTKVNSWSRGICKGVGTGIVSGKIVCEAEMIITIPEIFTFIQNIGNCTTYYYWTPCC